MRSYSPESIQCAEENKMKALLALSRKSSLLVDGARDELLSFAFPFGNEQQGALEGKAKNNFISFPLKHFLRKISLHCVPIRLLFHLSLDERKKWEFSSARLFMFLFGRRQLHYGDIWIRTIRRDPPRQCFTFFFATNTLNPPQKTFEFSSRGKDKTANIFKVKAKDSKEFFFYLLFIFFNLCLISCVEFIDLLFSVAQCFRLRFRFTLRNLFRILRFPLKWCARCWWRLISC